MSRIPRRVKLEVWTLLTGLLSALLRDVSSLPSPNVREKLLPRFTALLSSIKDRSRVNTRVYIWGR